MVDLATEVVAEARREARVEATVVTLVASALFVALAWTSYAANWELLGVHGWAWLALCIPEVVLVVALLLSPRVDDHLRAHRMLMIFIGLVIVGNLSGLTLLTAALLIEKSSDLTAAQLLMSGGVLWLINVIVFGLAFWTLDCGGPAQRALSGHAQPDFQFPQDENPQLARPGWHPRLEDYLYVAITNGIAFSPTDAMPLTRWAKSLMALDTIISVGAVLLVAARAVNVLGT
jgi:hypothetical protein